MSFVALAWASQQKLDRPSDKLILLAYANCFNEESGFAYPSVQWLCDFSSLNRKTVIQAVARLEESGFLEDTGRRVGSTKQVKVYTVIVGEIKTVPKRGPLKSTTFSDKESRFRDTEPVKEPTLAKAKDTHRRATRKCPDDWSPSEADYDVGIQLGLTNPQIIAATAEFRDHTFPNAKVDWSATHRNWLREAHKRISRHDKPNRPDKTTQRHDNYAASWSGADGAAALLAARRNL